MKALLRTVGCFLLVALLVVGGFLALLVWMVNDFADGLCGNRIIQEFASPDQKYRAVLFERDCGATTNYSTQIELLRGSASLPNDTGNVLIADGRPEDNQLGIEWTDANNLFVRGTGGITIKHSTDQFETVRIHVEP